MLFILSDVRDSVVGDRHGGANLLPSLPEESTGADAPMILSRRPDDMPFGGGVARTPRHAWWQQGLALQETSASRIHF